MRIKARITKTEDIYLVYMFNGMTYEFDIDEIKEFFGDYDNKKYYKTSYNIRFAIEFNNMDGEPVAYVDEDYKLVIENSALFKEILYHKNFDYITTEEYAAKHHKNIAMIKRYCKEGRIKGIIQFGRIYLIPENAEYPEAQKPGRQSSKP